MLKTLTPNQEIVLKVVRDFIVHFGKSPTLSELKLALRKAGLKLSSINSVVQYLCHLEEKGYIQRFAKTRGIRLLNQKQSGSFVELPLLGNANCGEALSFADDYVEDYVNVSKSFIKGDKNDYFIVKAVGESMSDEDIHDSDYVLIKKNDNPKDNDNILVAINGLGVIKKFRQNENGVALIPCSKNKNYHPIFIHESDEIHVCGKVVDILHPV